MVRSDFGDVVHVPVACPAISCSLPAKIVAAKKALGEPMLPSLSMLSGCRAHDDANSGPDDGRRDDLDDHQQDGLQT
ncbi:hypothetical protein [Mesorhizobium sp. B1-1-7]|uniref:hypothetical protein n=1 Tax=Mesorhizobium sp. B1-1-7 TaxID=2589977 RepID=UPI00112E90D2|nr:hypothetical protein [Mesorhizobium sp. B1-1-7]TPN46119.1 hypothetical protein FJ978_26135 [Mesorhizobium sp. B1-1-7]